MKYILTHSRFEHPAGTVVYDCQRHDYGLSRDDTIYTGEEHISVTLDESGDYPLFTVPVGHLNPVK